MDEAFGRMSGRYRISLIDSTMMWIVHRAMDKAHERAQCKEGVIECLTEISKFYELAVMQLEGCLKFVNEEADSSLESSDEEVLGDLAEIRDRLVGRLKESQLAIAEKDKELAWRLENELKLRKALKLKERKTNEGVEELIHGNKAGVDEPSFENQISAEEDIDEDFSGLKHSVEQQVWNIKQKLEPEYKSERRRNKSCDRQTIEQMGSDIDILKETMDIAFGKMQSAIFMSEMEPLEQQWRFKIEKDALAILIQGFMGDIQDNFKAQVRVRQKQVSCGLSKHLSDLMKEMKCLRDDLEALCLSESNHEGKNFPRPRGKSPAEEDEYSKPRSYSSSAEEVDKEKQHGEEEPEDASGNFVAKLIKNHESFIKKKNKELNRLKRENSGEKGSSFERIEQDLVKPRKRIEDVIERMQNLVEWNEKLSENLEDYEGDGNEEGSSTERLRNFSTTKEVASLIENPEDFQEKVKKISMPDAVNQDLQNEIRILREEKEDVSFQTMIMEKTYAALLEGFVYESSRYRYDLEILIREGIHEDVLKKMVDECNERMESDKIDAQIKEEMHYIVLSEAMKNFDSVLDSTLVECHHARAEISLLQDHNLEGRLREDMSKVLLGEICREWNEFAVRIDAVNLVAKERYRIAYEETLGEIRSTTDHKISKLKDVNLEGKFREETSSFLFGELWKEWNEVIERSDVENLVCKDIYHIAIQETLINIANKGNCLTNKPNEAKNSENGMRSFPSFNESFQVIEQSVKEDVYIVFLKAMFKEIEAQNFESFIRQEILLLLLVESVKEANAAYRDNAAHDHFHIYQEPVDELNRSTEEEILITKEESQADCIKLEEQLNQIASCGSKEYKAQSSSIQLKHENLDKLKITRELLTEMGSTFASVGSRVEKALEQLTVSKALVTELRSCLGVAVEGQELSVASAHDVEPSWLQHKEIKRVKLSPSCSASRPVMEFLQVFMDFKCMVEEKLELNILRLEEAVQSLNPLAELVAKRKREEQLYRKAFISRCENLRKAETEVDLLGNQVDVLLSLLEKIYNILHHYSPVLRIYFEVSAILKMIRKELIGEVLGLND